MSVERWQILLTKRELESIPSLVRQLDYNQKLLEGLSLDIPDGAKGIDYTKDRVQSSNQDRQEELIVDWISRMESVKKKIHSRTKKLQLTIDKVYKFVESIEDSFDREIIERHCIYGESFYSIGKSMTYTKGGISRKYYRCLEKHGIK